MGVETAKVGLRHPIHADNCSEVEVNSINVFLSDDLSPSSVHINLFLDSLSDSGMLYSFHVQAQKSRPYFSVTEAYNRHCISAIPIIATRHNVLDTLVLNSDKSLGIITSFGRSIPVGTPKQPNDGRDEVARKLASSLSMAFDDNNPMGERHPERKIMHLLDPVGPRCTIVFEDGERLRLSADFRLGSRITRQCLDALSCVLPAEAFFVLKRELLAQVNTLSAVQQGDDATEFGIFARLVVQLLGFPVVTPKASPLEAVLGRAETDNDPITRRLAARLRLRHAPRRNAESTMSSKLIFEQKLDPSTAPLILFSVHLVTQDCRLSSTRQRDLLRLATVLSELAGKIRRVDWQDFWIRLVPNLLSPPPGYHGGGGRDLYS